MYEIVPFIFTDALPWFGALIIVGLPIVLPSGSLSFPNTFIVIIVFSNAVAKSSTAYGDKLGKSLTGLTVMIISAFEHNEGVPSSQTI